MNGVQGCCTGYLPKDCDQRYTANGKAMVTFSLAVEDSKKAEGADTEWLKVVIFGELAETLAPRLLKGAHVYIEGRTKLNRWAAADGSERSGLEMVAWTCQPMGQIGRKNPAAQQDARRAVASRALDDEIPY